VKKIQMKKKMGGTEKRTNQTTQKKKKKKNPQREGGRKHKNKKTQKTKQKPLSRGDVKVVKRHTTFNCAATNQKRTSAIKKTEKKNSQSE